LLEKQVDPSQLDNQGRTVLDVAEQNNDVIMRRQLLKNLDIIQPQEEGVVVNDVETGTSRRTLKRKSKHNDSKQLEDWRNMFMHNAPATFWFVSVSLATFQYLTDIRQVCWTIYPSVALCFELGVVCSIALFVVTVWTDPGKVRPRPKGASGVDELLKSLATPSLGKAALVDASRLCTTTWVLKEPRTKYCTRTEACVEEFDHFCGWLNVAIGRGNHRPFIFLALVEVFTQICHFFLCWTAAGELVKAESTGLWMLAVGAQYPLTGMMIALQGLTTPGVVMLCIHQLRCVFTNMTTNEMMNSYRYPHFWKEVTSAEGITKKVFSNPFDKGGPWANCVDFWWNRRRSARGPGH